MFFISIVLYVRLYLFIIVIFSPCNVFYSERPPLINISSTKGTSLRTIIEIEKSHSTLENAIAFQENKKGNFSFAYSLKIKFFFS